MLLDELEGGVNTLTGDNQRTACVKKQSVWRVILLVIQVASGTFSPTVYFQSNTFKR